MIQDFAGHELAVNDYVVAVEISSLALYKIIKIQTDQKYPLELMPLQSNDEMFKKFGIIQLRSCTGNQVVWINTDDLCMKILGE